MLAGRWSCWPGGGRAGWEVVMLGGRWSCWAGSGRAGREVVLLGGRWSCWPMPNGTSRLLSILGALGCCGEAVGLRTLRPGARTDGRRDVTGGSETGCQWKAAGMKTKCLPPHSQRINLRGESDEGQAWPCCPRGAAARGPPSHAADAVVPAANLTLYVVGRGLEEPPRFDGLLLICISNEAGAQPGSVLLCLLLRKCVYFR